MMKHAGDPSWFDPDRQPIGPSREIARTFGIAAASGSLRAWEEAEPLLHELWAELGDSAEWNEARQTMYMVWKGARRLP